MFAFLRDLRSRRQAEHDAYLAALQSVVKVVEAMARASEAQAETMRDLYAFYKVDPSDLPEARVHTDQTEAALEVARLERMKARGFPHEGSTLDQGRWVASQMDFGGSY